MRSEFIGYELKNYSLIIWPFVLMKKIEMPSSPKLQE